MDMTSTVRLAGVADLARVCTTATRAFADDPLLRWFFPDDDEYEMAAPAAFGQMAERSIGLGCTYVTPDVVAVGISFPPGHHHPGAQDTDGDDAGADDGLTIAPELAARFAAFGAVVAQHTPPELHWYLNVLATHPDWQRQGHGAAIVAPIAHRSEEEGVPLYLETETAANVAYYGHLGFRVRSEWDLPLAGPHMWGMIRER
jgi:GNAT superfamily N-acetyltransferase